METLVAEQTDSVTFESFYDTLIEKYGNEKSIPLNSWKELKDVLRRTEPDHPFDPLQWYHDQIKSEGPSVVKEIRRDGQRILKAGTNVFVQPSRKKGTRKYEGWVVECYDDNTVKVRVPLLGDERTVEADEFVVARRGTTKTRGGQA
jgi:hypothetical protein